MNPFLLIYTISAIAVFCTCFYEAYADYKRGEHLKLTSGILAPLFITILPILNTLIVIYFVFHIICDNPTILKGKR